MWKLFIRHWYIHSTGNICWDFDRIWCTTFSQHTVENIQQIIMNLFTTSGLNKTKPIIGPLTPTINRDKSGLRFWILCLSVLCLFSPNFLIYLYSPNIARGQSNVVRINEYRRIGIVFRGGWQPEGGRRVLTAWLGTIFTWYIYPIWNN